RRSLQQWKNFIFAMIHSSDGWYIRLPDGRVLRAKTTRSVRHNLVKGRIHPESHVRRPGEEEWVALEGTEEFADLVLERVAGDSEELEVVEEVEKFPRPRRASRTSPPQKAATPSQPIPGSRGMVQQLLVALDSTLSSVKLGIAAVTGIAVGAVLA